MGDGVPQMLAEVRDVSCIGKLKANCNNLWLLCASFVVPPACFCLLSVKLRKTLQLCQL